MRTSSPKNANRWIRVAGVVVLLASLITATVVFQESPPPPPEHIPVQIPAGIDESLVDKTWIVAVAELDALKSFEHPGWDLLVSRSDTRQAVEALSPDGGLDAARAHADASSMYNQAAVLVATSVVQTYGNTPRETDPKGIAHLLTVSYAILGQPDEAIRWSATLGAADSAIDEWHQPWREWLAQGAQWPPHVGPTLEPRVWPVPPVGPDYILADDVSSGIEVHDPVWLVALAQWHEEQARHHASGTIIDLYTARYRLPAQAPIDTEVTLPMSFLFGSELLVAEDAGFVAALLGRLGADAVDVYAQTSLLASLAQQSRVDGVVDAEKAADLANDLHQVLIDKQRQQAGRVLAGRHRKFAEIAELSVYRTLALVAEIEGAHETSGILRIGAHDQATGLHGANPAFILSFAIYDADNRYTIRPLERLDQLIRRNPELSGSRWALEALALRVVRDRR